MASESGCGGCNGNSSAGEFILKASEKEKKKKGHISTGTNDIGSRRQHLVVVFVYKIVMVV